MLGHRTHQWLFFGKRPFLAIPVMAGGWRGDGGMFWVPRLSEAKITWPLLRQAMAALLLALPNKRFAQITSIVIIWFKF